MLEKVLKFSIQNRWLIVLLALGAAAVGVFSFQRLPIDAVPDITNNQVQINTLAAALSPEQIEKQVTFPVETALAGIPGLQYTRSLSRNGFSQVTAVFGDDVDIYFARNQINERLGVAKEGLPQGVEPKMGPISTGLGEIYMWTVEYQHPLGEGAKVEDGEPGWQSDGAYLTPEGQRLETETELASFLRTVQDWIIRPQLKNVEGVAGIDVIGGYEKQYHIQPNPMTLVSYGLTFRDVIDALEKNNSARGAGYVENKGESYTVRIGGRLENIEQVAETVVGQKNGTPIHVRDVATVGIGAELRTGSASENGHEVVAGTALMLIGANSRTVARAVDAKMADVNRSLPPDVMAKTVYNRTKLVNATVRTVERNLTEGAVLVVVVLFVMLGNIRAAIITALAIPLSMLMTVTGMVQGKISGNLMSLGAIDFGLIVDGAVIIVENCLRHLAERQHELKRTLNLGERLETVAVSAKEMIRPSVFGQAIIVTVYFPILALTGTEGKMFKPMALTVILALASAFILSLTLIPALVAILIRGRVRETENFIVRGAKWGYAPVLRLAIRGRWIVAALAVLCFGGSLFLFTRLGQEFAPTLDEMDLAIEGRRIPSINLMQSTEMQFEVERTISTLPEVAFVFSKTGTAEMASDPMGPNSSDTFIILKPRDQWRSEDELGKVIEKRSRELEVAPKKNVTDRGAEASEESGGHKAVLIKLIELELSALPGNAYEFTQPIQMRFNELIAGVRGDVAVKVFGDDFEVMGKPVAEIAKALKSIRGAADVKVEETEGLPVLSIEPDRKAISRFGLNVSDVQDVVATAIGGREAGMIQEGDRRFALVVRLPELLRSDLNALGNLPVPLRRSGDEGGEGNKADQAVPAGSTRPGFVPLSTLAKVEVTEGRNQISRDNGKRRIVIQCNVRGRDIGSFVTEAEEKVRAINLPAGSWLQWGGQFENLIAARRRLMVVVPLCFFLIFLLLFGTFGSVKHAVLVFSGVPLALTGGIVALWLRDMPFSISAAVGFIALSGVAVLNGLVMVIFINQLRSDGAGLEDSILRGSLTRLRPVLMTALVASLGFVPMAISTGTGSEVQKPLATVVIGGILSSTLLTLLVLPALYRLWHREERVAVSADSSL